MTKRELADLIVSGMDDQQLYMAGPTRGITDHVEYTPEFVAAYIAKRRTLAELERWADDLTKPEVGAWPDGNPNY
jgi:hypothetical protein